MAYLVRIAAPSPGYRKLLSYLNPAQVTYLNAHGYIPVLGSLGGRYVVGQPAPFNIHGERACYCLVPRYAMPHADTVLGQVLLLAASEQTVLAAAKALSAAGLTTDISRSFYSAWPGWKEFKCAHGAPRIACATCDHEAALFRPDTAAGAPA